MGGAPKRGLGEQGHKSKRKPMTTETSAHISVAPETLRHTSKTPWTTNVFADKEMLGKHEYMRPELEHF